MKIVLCNGGLGNQVFQYIFSRWLELATGDACYLNDAVFWSEKPEHNGFEIPRVFPNSKPRLLSSYFTEDVWRYMVDRQCGGVSVCQQIKDSGGDIVMVAETDDYRFDGNVVVLPTNAYLPSLIRCKGNIYFHGYWINRDYLKSDFYEEIRRELTFAPLTEKHNIEYARQIAECRSVSIHIRRGDFVKLHRETSAETYKAVVEAAEKNVKDAHYFVFSDDLPWCKENKESLGLNLGDGRVTFVEGNRGALNFRDMQLMTKCKVNLIIGNTSFSYLAALLNENPDALYLNATGRQV